MFGGWEVERAVAVRCRVIVMTHPALFGSLPLITFNLLRKQNPYFVAPDPRWIS